LPAPQSKSLLLFGSRLFFGFSFDPKDPSKFLFIKTNAIKPTEN